MLPKPNVIPDNNAEGWTEDEVRRVICNPLHVLDGTVTEEQFVDAAKRLVQEEGLEQYLVNVLQILREELVRCEEDEGDDEPSA